MYKLPYFTEEDQEKVISFIKENPFAIVTGIGVEYPVASHLPLEIEIKENRLFFSGHLMRNTDHHKAFMKNDKVLVIFNGPHSYVSASWYGQPKVASTWNYITVHAKGKIVFTDEDGTYNAIRSITEKYEGKDSAAAFDKLPKEYISRLIGAIVGFTIEVTSFDNVFKLSQNHHEADKKSIAHHLKHLDDNDAAAIAKEMEKRLPESTQNIRMDRKKLIQKIHQKESYLCVGLDTDLDKIPVHLKGHPKAILEFNRQIIDATKDLCVSYKINTAFYEAMGSRGWDIMEETLDYIPSSHFKIADAKRADIGNTSGYYAKAFFETLKFDAITVAPYMGEDSVRPFLEYENKWTIVLGLTSNKGAADFELLQTNKGLLFERVLNTVSSWGSSDNLMFVIGATKASELANIRKIIPDHFLLVPGVGFQGGSLAEVSEFGMNKDVGLLVNVSRAIIYAGEKEDFAAEARIISQQYQSEMSVQLKATQF